MNLGRKLDVVNDDNRQFRLPIIKDETSGMQIIMNMSRTARKETADQIRSKKQRDVARRGASSKDSWLVRLSGGGNRSEKRE